MLCSSTFIGVFELCVYGLCECIKDNTEQCMTTPPSCPTGGSQCTDLIGNSVCDTGKDW